MKIQNTYTAIQPKINKNFKSTINPTPFLKEGFEFAKKINNVQTPPFSDLYSVKRFARGLIDILLDGREYFVTIAQSERKSSYSLFHDVLINNEKVIIEGTCLGASPANIGKNAMDAVIRLTEKLPGETSHYDRLLAGYEKRPLQFKSDIKQAPLKYNQQQNNAMLKALELIIFPEK